MSNNIYTANSSVPPVASIVNGNSETGTATAPATNPNYNPSLASESDKIIYIPPSNVILDDDSTYYYNSSPPSSVSSSVNYSQTANPARLNNNNNNNNFNRHSSNTLPSTPSDLSIRFPVTGHYRTINGRRIYVKPKNAHLPDDVIDFKQKRKRRTAVAAWTGGAVGLFTMGPLGAIGGAVGGYAIAKGVGKTREHRITRKHNASSSATHSTNMATPAEHQGTFT